VEIQFRIDDDVLLVGLSPGEGARRRCTIGDRHWDVELLRLAGSDATLVVDGRLVRALVARDGRDVLVAVGGTVHRFSLLPPGADAAPRPRAAGSGQVLAPMPGKVLDVLVHAGDHVLPGDPVAVVEAMKMEHTLRAEIEGTVGAVHVAPGTMVDGAQLLLEIRPEPSR
jgi:acetyl/propionyl-CoA carboxylase alpha subunit